MADRGSYLYAISRGVTDDDLSDTTGLRGARLRVVGHRGLAAVVSDVPLDEFGEEGLRHNLEDLAWLEETARAHDDVVHATARRGPTAPMRLATVCIDDGSVRTRLEEWHDQLVRALDRVAGRAEWSVKAFAPPVDAASPTPVPDAGTGTGTSYLMRRRAEVAQRERAADVAIVLADRVHADLAAHAVASRRLSPQDPRLSGHEGTMILNGAYLVDAGDEAAFTATIRRLGEDNPEFRLSAQGPWPPYSFATVDDP
jgi:hypothetical protein